ncbi:MAG TPA: polysaccharide pyruvyl transferase family protein [Streptosporangiaceae bacterium]|nr:polysaccharide pyruvyl transferase family protein [Streptosporangiaceae bacterium]
MTDAASGPRPDRVLIVSWASFLHGEATAGDVLAMEAAREALSAAGIACDLAWSPVFRPGARTLADSPPGDYTHLVFTCGPAHGWQVERLHERYRSCHRIAVGVSVIDPADPAVAGFHHVFPRDAPGMTGRLDLAGAVPVPAVPVAAVILAAAQPEYADRGRHSQLTTEIGGWLATIDCARVPVDTRLAHGDWRSPATAAQVEAVISRADVVVTTRLHGLVLALKNGVPALAIDPVTGGAKVAAQAAVWGWPVLLPRYRDAVHHGPVPGHLGLDEPVLDRGELDRLWAWCRSAPARARAGAAPGAQTARPLTADLLSALKTVS